MGMNTHHLTYHNKNLLENEIMYLYVVLHLKSHLILREMWMNIFANSLLLIFITSIWIMYGPVFITQNRSWWLNIRINYKNNHVSYLIIQILIATPLAQLVQNTRLMLGMGGYSAAVPKWEASVAKR